jgi:hypothetical protein
MSRFVKVIICIGQKNKRHSSVPFLEYNLLKVLHIDVSPGGQGSWAMSTIFNGDGILVFPSSVVLHLSVFLKEFRGPYDAR